MLEFLTSPINASEEARRKQVFCEWVNKRGKGKVNSFEFTLHLRPLIPFLFSLIPRIPL